MKRKPSNTVVHEVDDTRHRIVVIGSEGQNTVGEWVSITEIATHNKGYYAICGEGVLPQGVFTCKVVAHQVLA